MSFWGDKRRMAQQMADNGKVAAGTARRGINGERVPGEYDNSTGLKMGATDPMPSRIPSPRPMAPIRESAPAQTPPRQVGQSISRAQIAQNKFARSTGQAPVVIPSRVPTPGPLVSMAANGARTVSGKYGTGSVVRPPTAASERLAMPGPVNASLNAANMMMKRAKPAVVVSPPSVVKPNATVESQPTIAPATPLVPNSPLRPRVPNVAPIAEKAADVAATGAVNQIVRPKLPVTLASVPPMFPNNEAGRSQVAARDTARWSPRSDPTEAKMAKGSAEMNASTDAMKSAVMEKIAPGGLFSNLRKKPMTFEERKSAQSGIPEKKKRI